VQILPGSYCATHIHLQHHDCKATPADREIEKLEVPAPLKAIKLLAVKGKAAKEKLGEVVRLEAEFEQYLDDL